MVFHAWSIRDEKEPEYECDQLYEGTDGLFSVCIHHGGIFEVSPMRSYINGQITYVDFLDIDLFSIIEFNDVMKEMGYDHGEKKSYYFLIPDSDLDFGLLALTCDEDCHKLAKYVGKHKVIHVYIEHGDTRLDDDVCINVTPNKSQKGLLLKWIPSSVGETNNKGHEVSFDKILNFDPFGDDTHSNLGEKSSNKGKAVDVEQSEDSGDETEDSGDDSQDSDYILDEENEIIDVQVDMRDFKLNIDENVEYMGPLRGETESTVNVDEMEVEVIDNDEFDSGIDSDAEIEYERLQKLKELQKRGGSKASQTVFYVGQVFSTSNEVKELIKKHAVETRREVKLVKNDKARLRAICMGNCPQFTDDMGSASQSGPTSQKKGGKSIPPKSLRKGSSVITEQRKGKGSSVITEQRKGKGSSVITATCPWILQVSKLKDAETWQVKTYKSAHTCLQSRKVRACTAEFLSQEIVQLVQGNPNIPVKALQNQLEQKYQLGVSKMKAFRAKERAAVYLQGDHISQYWLLRDYCLELKRANPGSTVKIDVEPCVNPESRSRQFRRIYICLGPLKSGFKACKRDFLGLDGSFLKGPFPGQILTAVGLDANNGIYPLAYAIVEAETKQSWTWFLECIGDDLDLSTNSNFTFISDRQKGILPAIAQVFPCSEHRFCLRHIHENFKLRWRGKAYKDFLWKCGSALTVHQFEQAMKNLKSFNEEAGKWLSKIPPPHWCRSHFSGRACTDLLLNNLCEVFNRQLVEGRDKPIITCLEFIREYCMRRIVIVQRLIEKSGGPLTPTAARILENIKKEAAQYTVIWNGGSKYQVTGPWMDQCVVDITSKDCSCRKWEITGIPCKHLVVVIWNKFLNGDNVGLPEAWVDEVYWLETWKKTYEFKIGPINGREMWLKSDCPTSLTAPKHHKPIGRPRKKRRRGVDEVDSMEKGGKLSRALKTVTCGKCNKKGHNSRSCKGQGTNDA